MEKEQNENDFDTKELAIVARRAAVKVSARYPAITTEELLSAAYEGAARGAEQADIVNYGYSQAGNYLYKCAIGYAINEAKFLSNCHKIGNLPPDHPDNNVRHGISIELTYLARSYPHHVQLLTWLLEGYTQKEIAEKLGISQSAVSQRIKRISPIVKGIWNFPKPNKP